MLKIAYLTKKMDACYWLRCLTPSGVLVARGHQVQDALFEQQLWCYDCKKGPFEFQWNDKKAFVCPHCKKQLMTDDEKKDWVSSLDRIIEESDIVCFQRPTSKESIELIKHCKDRGKKTTQVADDNYLDIPTWNNGYNYYTQRRGIIEETLRVVDALDVTVPYLVERYKAYNSFIEVLPNCHDKEILDSSPPLPSLTVFDGSGKRIDTNIFYEAREKNKLVVWGGSPTHEKDLELVLTSIRRVSRQEKVAFAFVGYAHRALIEIVPKDRLFLFSLVPNSIYLSMMQMIRGDIGIAPVAEHPFNLGKSNLRVLEYCFFKWLPVSSNFPTYAGAAPQGLYANNSDYDWYMALRKAINMDVEERSQRVDENRRYAEEHYDISKQIYRWENFFEKLLAGERQ
jgi:glycosyltransferase involved in cell wall biosynthesis